MVVIVSIPSRALDLARWPLAKCTGPAATVVMKGLAPQKHEGVREDVRESLGQLGCFSSQISCLFEVKSLPILQLFHDVFHPSHDLPKARPVAFLATSLGFHRHAETRLEELLYFP